MSRVHRHSVYPNLQVQMGSGGVTGRPDETTDLPGLYLRAVNAVRESDQVHVQRLHPPAVVDGDVVARPTGLIGGVRAACRGRDDALPRWRGDVPSGVAAAVIVRGASLVARVVARVGGLGLPVAGLGGQRPGAALAGPALDPGRARPGARFFYSGVR